MNLLERAKRLTRGVLVLTQWVANGVVVEKSLANSRALTCSTCDQNKDGLTLPPSVEHAVKEQLDLKNALSIETNYDDKINTCAVCLCCLRLKVWTPRDLLVKYETPASLEEFPSHCWIRTESNLT